MAAKNLGCLRNLFLEFAELDGTDEIRDAVGSGYRGAVGHGKELGSYSKPDASHWRFHVSE